MPDDVRPENRDLKEAQRKDAEAVRNVTAPESEQAMTRDTTPSVEKPGKEPTRPERPPAK